MSNSVYKYYLNGHQYTPKNTGDITINVTKCKQQLYSTTITIAISQCGYILCCEMT